MSALITELDLKHIRLMTYLNVATVCLWVYDYMLTLELEVSLFWKAPWKLSKVLFLFTRYLPFATMGLLLYHQFEPTISQTTCVLTYRVASWMISISICLTESMYKICLQINYDVEPIRDLSDPYYQNMGPLGV